MLYTVGMTEAEAKTQLETEGYRNISAWLDSPAFAYPEHTHHFMIVHIILTGEMFMTMNGLERRLHPNDRIDIPAGTAHAAIMGPNGCMYVSGEK